MVRVCCDVEVHAIAGFVELEEFVFVHFYCGGIEVSEEFWGCDLAGVVD